MCVFQSTGHVCFPIHRLLCDSSLHLCLQHAADLAGHERGPLRGLLPVHMRGLDQQTHHSVRTLALEHLLRAEEGQSGGDEESHWYVLHTMSQQCNEAISSYVIKCM